MMAFDRSRRGPALLLALALLAPTLLTAQAPPEEAAAEPAPAPKRTPPAKRKPPKAEPARPVADAPRSAPTPAALAPPAKAPELVVVCDANAAARYEDAKGFVIWVTRSGTISVENPLRPLTPETTRVLQVIIGARIATAYGPDLFGLRRGTTPAALETTTGGPIVWDAELAVLPDPLTIVSEFGETLAQLAFKECGTAPPVKAVPAAAAKTPSRKVAAPKPAAAPVDKPPAGLRPPPGLQVPQGAIP
jgi:hypothetical protein